MASDKDKAKLFLVEVKYSGEGFSSRRFRVWAKDKTEAGEIALDIYRKSCIIVGPITEL